MARGRFPYALFGYALLAGCAAPAPTAPGDEAACSAQGGKWRTAGMMQIETCEIRYPDAGKSCTDGSQCAGGECLTDAVPADQAGAPATGVCKPSNVTEGCYSQVEDGRTQPGQCAE